jgi:hypothetical protein
VAPVAQLDRASGFERAANSIQVVVLVALTSSEPSLACSKVDPNCTLFTSPIRLKIRWPPGREGSIPFSGTKKPKRLRRRSRGAARLASYGCRDRTRCREVARLNAVQEIQLMAFDVNQLRERLHKMTDDELREFGKAAAYMVSPNANRGKPPREAFVVQLAEARAEWARRHPKKPTTT